MRGKTLVGVVVAIAVAAPAAPAAAEPTRLDRLPGDVLEGPRVADQSVFYGEIGRTRTVLRVASPGGERRKLASLSSAPSSPGEEDSPGDFLSFSSAIAASPDRFGYKVAYTSGNARYQVGSSTVTQFGGASGPNEPFGELDRCSNDGIYGPASASLDIDGPRVAASDCTGQVVIRDYSKPVPDVYRVNPGNGLAIGDLAFAGPYLAYNAYAVGPTGSTPTVTVVHDWLTNSKVYEVPRVGSFDLDPDGTLMVSTGRVDDLDCDEGKLAWYSIAEPTEHVLPVKPCTGDVRAADGSIATILAGPEGDERMLSLVRLDGTRTDVARLGAALRRGGIDYDNSRVAYALGNCLGGADILIEDATAPALRDEPPACPVGGLPRRDALGPKDTTALVNVNCPRGCRGRIAITANTGGEIRQIGTRAVRIAPESECLSLLHRVPIKPSARSAMRRRGSLLARVTVTTNDRDGAPRVTSRGFRLRAASKNRAVPPGDCGI